METAGTGITCNVVCPGWVLTPCKYYKYNIILFTAKSDALFVYFCLFVSAVIVPQIEAIAEREGISFEEAKVIKCICFCPSIALNIVFVSVLGCTLPRETSIQTVCNARRCESECYFYGKLVRSVDESGQVQF